MTNREALRQCRDEAHNIDLDLSRVLHELAGSASLCWEPRPTGVFSTYEAIAFVEGAIAEIREPLRKAIAAADAVLAQHKCKACFGSGEDFNEGDPCHVCGGTGVLAQPAKPSTVSEWQSVKDAKAQAEYDLRYYNEMMAKKNAAQPAPEPVAWRWKERINKEFVTAWIVTTCEPPPNAIYRQPLYAHPPTVTLPPPDERKDKLLLRTCLRAMIESQNANRRGISTDWTQMIEELRAAGVEVKP
jgi:hypothetical protein